MTYLAAVRVSLADAGLLAAHSALLERTCLVDVRAYHNNKHAQRTPSRTHEQTHKI